MTVISDSTPLIGLSMLDRLSLLKQLFGRVLVPPAVYEEVVVAGSGRIGSQHVQTAVAAKWMRIQKIRNESMFRALSIELDIGEAEAITLSMERHADLVLIDEQKARIQAKALNLRVTGTIGVLLLAVERNIKIDLEQSILRLRENGFHLSDALIKRILKDYK